MTRQRRALGQAIGTALSYAEGESFVTSTMARMADVHSRHGRVPVAGEFYDIWLDCWIATLAECDPQWNPALETTWRTALTPAIALFKAHY